MRNRDLLVNPLVIRNDPKHNSLVIWPDRVVVNDGSFDLDFCVESDNNSYMFFVDAGNDRVGIGTNSPDEKFEVEWTSGGTDAEIGRGTTDTDITFIALRNENGQKCYIYPNAAGNDLIVTTTHP